MKLQKSPLYLILPVLLLLGAVDAAKASVTVGNTIYDATILTSGDTSTGSWTAFTGSAHPTGALNNLIYPGASTSFSSLRVYGAGGPLDYTYDGSGGGINLDLFVTGEGDSPFVPSGQGWQTTWSVTPEGLDITQDVIIVPPPAGASIANSAIYHTVVIANVGGATTAIGWRNLYDWAVNEEFFDDGPNNSIDNGGSVVVAPTTIEFSHTPSAGDIVRVAADPQVPTYEPLLGIGFDPGFVAALTPTVPDEYVYAGWGSSFGTAFDYTPSGSNVTGDSAGLAWFGRDAARAIELAPGESVRLTQVVFGVAPDAPPPGGAIPEPASVLVWSVLGLVGIFAVRRQRQRRAG